MRHGDGFKARFEVVRSLAGGMGDLLVVRDRSSGKILVAKTPRGTKACSGDELQMRFAREARAWLALGPHENIVEGQWLAEIDGRSWLFLEYVDGVDLERLCKAAGPLPVAQAVEFAEGLLAALDRVHRTRLEPSFEGLVHRDVKPSNIVVRKDRRAKLADFGLVKIIGASFLTTDRQGLGTLSYSAPEQLQSAAGVDHRADLYSAGAVLYRMLTDGPPLVRRSLGDLLVALEHDRPEPLSDVRPECPPALSEIVEALLEKDPEKRPRSAVEVAERLAAVPIEEDAAVRCAACGLMLRAELQCCPLCRDDVGRAES